MIMAEHFFLLPIPLQPLPFSILFVIIYLLLCISLKDYRSVLKELLLTTPRCPPGCCGGPYSDDSRRAQWWGHTAILIGLTAQLPTLDDGQVLTRAQRPASYILLISLCCEKTRSSTGKLVNAIKVETILQTPVPLLFQAGKWKIRR